MTMTTTTQQISDQTDAVDPELTSARKGWRPPMLRYQTAGTADAANAGVTKAEQAVTAAEAAGDRHSGRGISRDDASARSRITKARADAKARDDVDWPGVQ